MFIFILILSIPIAAAIITFIIYVAKNGMPDQDRWQLFLAFLPIIPVAGAILAFSIFGQTMDEEVWNGHVTSKEQVRVSCSHSYSCNCRQSCTSSGKGGQSCTTVCDTCYEHSNDYDWDL